MKYSAAILALVAAASAQSLSDLPSCAKSCLDDGIAKASSCSTTDVACVCKNFEAIESASLNCVVSACGLDVAVGTVQPLAQKICDNLGSAAPSESAPSSSAAAAPPTSSAAPPTSAAAPPTSAAAPPTSSAAPPTSAPASSAPPTSAPANSAPASSSAPGSSTTLKSVPTGTGSVNGTVPTSSPHVGGAAGLTSVGGLVMLALGALAL